MSNLQKKIELLKKKSGKKWDHPETRIAAAAFYFLGFLEKDVKLMQFGLRVGQNIYKMNFVMTSQWDMHSCSAITCFH